MKIYDKIEPQRTVFLWILCIFTFIGAGFSALSYLIYALFPNLLEQSVEIIQSVPMFADEQFQTVLEAYLSIKSWKYALMFLVEVAIFVGPMLMLVKLNPVGFHIYTLGQVAKFCVQTFVIGGMFKMGPSAVLLIVMMITLFSTQLRFMQTDSGTDDTGESDDNNIEIEEP